jgi:hypothetical protein
MTMPSRHTIKSVAAYNHSSEGGTAACDPACGGAGRQSPAPLNSIVGHHMKHSARAVSLVVVLSASGCQTIPREDAALCPELARFANASSDSATHTVELTTDWGGRFAEKTAGEDVMSQKTCNHFGYAPGKSLCNYLIQNISTEFPDANVNSVMVCLAAAHPTRMVYDLDYGTTVLWSHVARGAKPGVIVGIDYSTGTDSAPPTLKILARKDH